MWSGTLQLEFVRGEFKARVIGDGCSFKYEGVDYPVPAGFETDFGSVPGYVVLVCLVPRIGLLRDSFILHDYLYRYNGISRHEADTIFRAASHALLDDGIKSARGGLLGKWDEWGYEMYHKRVELAYLGIRWFGWIPWRRHRNAI